MAEPLFSPDELAEYKRTRASLDERYQRREMEWGEYRSERNLREEAHKNETVRRAQERAEEFLDALIVMVGCRGGVDSISFFDAFEKSDSDGVCASVSRYDTPETRRWLYTILRAFCEIPRSWARSATVRFFRGIGKQKGAKYHGAGMFSVAYGWKESEINAVCEWLINTLYGTVLMRFVDAQAELREDPDYEVLDVNEHAVTRVERDTAFIDKLCNMLIVRGIGPVPEPAVAKPKKPHVPKEFKSGDVIRKRDLRDLPLPAHVRIPVERLDEKSGQWLPAHIEHVVLKLHGDGSYVRAVVGPEKVAYCMYSWGDTSFKSWLDGATYLGLWEGKIQKKELRIKFRFRK